MLDNEDFLEARLREVLRAIDRLEGKMGILQNEIVGILRDIEAKL